MPTHAPSRLAEKEKKDKPPRKKHKIWLVVLLVVVALALAAVAGVAAAYAGLLPVSRAALPDLNARTGTLNAPDPNATAPDGGYIITINSEPVMTAGETTCNLGIENISGNTDACIVEVMLADTLEVIYTSYRVEPGKYVENADLARTFEPGTYNLIARHHLYTGSEESGGPIDFPVTLYVLEAGT